MPTPAEVKQAKDLLAQMVADSRKAAKEPLRALMDIQASAKLVACRPKLILLIQDHCVGCNSAKKELRHLIDTGLVAVISADTDEGQQIMASNNLVHTPTIALLDCDGKSAAEILKDDE